jgi:U3 small nucleolar RNA-associated protein 14
MAPTEHTSTLTVAKSSTQNDTSAGKQKKKQNVSTASEVSTKLVPVDDEEKNPWLQSTQSDLKSSSATTTAVKKKVSKRGMVDVEGAVDILDAGAPDKNHLVSKSSTDKDSSKADDGVEKKISTLSQEQLIRRAFATTSAKEADEEFQTEKDAMAEENDPTRKVKAEKGPKEVAGWGSWAGAGAPPPPKRKKPFSRKMQAPLKKEEPKRKRKDEDKKDVIINQKRLKKVANTFMLGDVPHPYTSRAEYEQAMLGGVGREWNVTSSFKNMTRPEILTRSGKIIQPISKKAKVARAPAKF